jgi:hypothetical protein
MKTTIKEEKDVEIKTLEVNAGVRYWEDATVNGVEDTEGNLIPCREGDRWCPLIDIDTGIIKDWPKGTIADIHYKVCDDGTYLLIDENNNQVLAIENDYVPDILCPKEPGYGDYIIMDIDGDGKIQNWKADISDFQKED